MNNKSVIENDKNSSQLNLKINHHQFSLDTPERERLWETRRKFFADYCINRWQWFNYPKWFYVADFPLHVDFEASFRCNLKCPMCFRPHIARKDWADMPFDTYKKGIDECAKNGLYSIRLNWRGEPTLNPNLPKMVKYAKDQGVKEVSFITNGWLIKDELADALVESGLDYITFSIDALYKKYEELRYPIKFDEITKIIEDLYRLKNSKGGGYPLIKVQAIWSYMKDNSEEFYKYFAPITDLVCFDPEADYSMRNVPQDPNFLCQYPWQRITVTHTGEVPLCISDWDICTNIGDLRKQTIKEIWHGKAMNDFRKMQLEHQRLKIECCRMCHRPEVPQIGNKIAGKQ
ncbi:MAG: radical SAM/SPASM domain-containing protein [Candidatus Omnitrophota bacterium]|jgi:MoaA/NifB/PqqE/SkfB family radical SAM enzyme